MRQQDERRRNERGYVTGAAQSAEDQARLLKEKYGGSAQASASTDFASSGGATVETARFVRNQPTAKHPKLFAISCKPGEEAIIVVRMYQKYARDRQRKPVVPSTQQFRSRFNKQIAAGAELEIFSIVAPGTKGIVYVEAMKQDAVMAATQGIEGLYRSKITIVKVDEMTDVLRVDIRKEVVRKGEFVRIRGPFPYKGDLAQVMNVMDAGSKVTVRVLPRIDFSTIENTASLQRKQAKPSAAHGPAPPAKFFIPEEIRAAGGNVTRETYPPTGKVMDMFNNQFYDGGLLLLDLSMRMVDQLTGASPYTAEELAVFSADGDGKSAMEAVAEQTKRKGTGSGLVAARKVINLSIGDHCYVVSGPDAGLDGVIENVNLVRQTASLKTKEVAGAVEIGLENLVKQFKVGDHVAVIAGADLGKTGHVVQVFKGTTRPKVLVMSSGQEELEVFNADLKISHELVTVGAHSLNGYVLYDLVQLDQNLHAIVVRVGTHTLHVMTQSGEVKEINPSAVRAKKNQQSKDAVVPDRANASIRINDPVQVVSGPHAGVSGTAKQIYAAIVFCHTAKREENAGIRVVKGKDCKLVAGMGTNKPGGGVLKPEARTSQYAPRTHRDELLGKTVRIRRGDEKGLTGIVVDGGSIYNVRVELNARNRVIAVPRENVTVVEPEPANQAAVDSSMYMPEDFQSNAQVPATPISSHYGYMSPYSSSDPSSSSIAAAAGGPAFSNGDSVKLVDTGESVTVYSVVDARDIVVITSKNEYKIVAASNLVYA